MTPTKIFVRLNYSFGPLSLSMLRFWPPIKKNENLTPYELAPLQY